MKRKITFLVVAVLCLQTLLAQNKTIRGTIVAVSYTHLTLPTSDLV